jgi:hypothetical protein
LVLLYLPNPKKIPFCKLVFGKPSLASRVLPMIISGVKKKDVF